MKGGPSYLTVEEMRNHVESFKHEHVFEEGGTRFLGSTSVGLGLEHLPREKAILECGPSLGKFTQMLQENGYTNIHALDFFDMLHFPDRSRLTFSLMDFNTERIPYSDGYFGGVTAWGIGEHLENPYHYMREVHRVLENGGVFIFSIPNMFHIMSRLVFLKRGIFPRWSERNNHIALFPRGVFEKTFLRYFELHDTVYIRPSIDYPVFSHLSRFLPANEWFGNFVVYILKKRASPLAPIVHYDIY